MDVDRWNFGMKLLELWAVDMPGLKPVDGSGRARPLVVFLFLLQGPKLPLPQGDARDCKTGLLLELNQAIVSAEDTRLASFPKPIKEFSRMVLNGRVCQGLSQDYLPHPFIISGAQCLGWVFVKSWCWAL